MAAWLQHPGILEFSDEDIGRVYEWIKSSHKNDFIALMDCLRESGWQTVPIPGSAKYDSRDHEFGEAMGVESFPIHTVLYNSDTQEIPLDNLEVGEVLLCALTPKKGAAGIAHQVAILRKSETEFTYYDPAFMQATTTREKCREILLGSADAVKKELFLMSKITHSDHR